MGTCPDLVTHPSVAGVGWDRGDMSWHQDWFDPGTCRPHPHPAVEHILANDPRTQVCSFSLLKLSFYTTLLKEHVKIVCTVKKTPGEHCPVNPLMV